MEKKNIMKKILIGFDGSEGSEQALNRAIMLIDEFGELILLAVVPRPSKKSFIDEDIYKSLKTKAKALIDDVIIDLGKQDFIITGLIEEGDPSDRIIDVANKLKVDLIVLGSKGTSELGQNTIGSVANKVVQFAAKPVMVVR
jgi:nucleotide-binding universal stress UspA family protein